MTHNEAIILSAYTGFLLVEDFSDVHKFCEDLLGRPIFTSEFADDIVLEEIREKCKPLLVEMQNPKTNYERIKSMSIEEMAEGITVFLTAHLNKYTKALGYDEIVLTAKEKEENAKKWKQMLESEVEE